MDAKMSSRHGIPPVGRTRACAMATKARRLATWVAWDAGGIRLGHRAIVLVLLLAAVAALAACGQQTVSRTPEGIPRKVVVRTANTPIYGDSQLRGISGAAQQWQIFFIFAETGDAYQVSADIGQAGTPQYLKKADVFEWNSRFILTFTGSPDVAKREQVRFYGDHGGAVNQNGTVTIIEKPSHRTNFVPEVDPILALKDHGGGIYYVGLLYDDIDEQGNYDNRGSYGFGFVKFDPAAVELRRYVTRAELHAQTLLVLKQLSIGIPSAPKSEVQTIYGKLADLLAVTGIGKGNVETGATDIGRVFAGGTAPKVTESGVFSPEHRQGNDLVGLDRDLVKLYQKMLDFYNDPSHWTKDGYGFVPVEWMQP